MSCYTNPLAATSPSPPLQPMDRAVLRSLSSRASSIRTFSRASHRLASSTRHHHHRLIPNLHRRTPLRHHFGRTSTVLPSLLNFSTRFSALTTRAIATSSTQFSQDATGSNEEVAEKLGFEKVSEQFIAECKSTAILYKHKKTGCEVMSVLNDDENKVFGVVFRTPPKDSTGIPHILEHSVLCGSRKYPLKEPFVELLKGSLHTFLNAFTYPDRTCYPVASTNTKVPIESLGIRRSYGKSVRDLSNRVYASYEDREYATGRADELHSTLESDFPSFVKPMLQSHVSGGFWLGLPVHFCKSYLPKRDEVMTLVDEDEAEWKTRYLPRKTGLSGGWKGFAEDHKLADGDALVFQLIKPTVFKVYIIRVNEAEDSEEA